jgi:hypothetical protein
VAPGRVRPDPFPRALAARASLSSDPRARPGGSRCSCVSPARTGPSASCRSAPGGFASARSPRSGTPTSAPSLRSPAFSAGSPRGHAPGRQLPERRTPSPGVDPFETPVASQDS